MSAKEQPPKQDKRWRFQHINCTKGQRTAAKVGQGQKEEQDRDKLDLIHTRRAQPLVISIDDETTSQMKPRKKVKEEELHAEDKDELNLYNQKDEAQKERDSQFERKGLKVIRLNHFFKRDGQIYFEVMLGSPEGRIYRWPQLRTLNSLLGEEQTKAMTYHFIASACKAVVWEQQIQEQSLRGCINGDK